MGATAYEYLPIRLEDNSLVKTIPANKKCDLTFCIAKPIGNGELLTGQPFREA